MGMDSPPSIKNWGPFNLNPQFKVKNEELEGFENASFGMIARKQCEVIVRTRI